LFLTLFIGVMGVWRGGSKAFREDAESPLPLVVAVLGIVCVLGSLAIIGKAHVEAPEIVAKVESCRAVLKFMRQGDPSYSGVLQTAVELNAFLAVARQRNASWWWDLNYPDALAEAEPIDMEAGR
jgi:hypothetical protein